MMKTDQYIEAITHGMIYDLKQFFPCLELSIFTGKDNSIGIDIKKSNVHITYIFFYYDKIAVGPESNVHLHAFVDFDYADPDLLTKLVNDIKHRVLLISIVSKWTLIDK